MASCGRLLIAEDEPLLRVSMADALRKEGWTVDVAADGAKAVALFEEHHHEVVLTDLVMPVGLNGQELAAKFGFTKPDLKVVYISGYSRDVAGRNLDAHDGHFLEKPFDARTLARTVRECLDR